METMALGHTGDVARALLRAASAELAHAGRLERIALISDEACHRDVFMCRAARAQHVCRDYVEMATEFRGKRRDRGQIEFG